MKVLAIGAHFDDVELGCGGTLLKHRDRGDEIVLLVVTHSGYESKMKKFSRSKEQAKEEGGRSAEILKADLICLEKSPIALLPTEALVLEIEDLINQVKPDRVYSHQPTDSHADHAAVGYVSIRAARKCNEVMLYRSNWYIMDDTEEGNYYVNISDHIAEKEKLLKLFKSEMENTNYTWIDFVKKQNCAAGAKVDVGYAETFHLVKMFWR